MYIFISQMPMFQIMYRCAFCLHNFCIYNAFLRGCTLSSSTNTRGRPAKANLGVMLQDISFTGEWESFFFFFAVSDNLLLE